MPQQISHFLKKYSLFLLLCVLIFFVYSPLLKTFYQQDEWNGVGLAYANGWRMMFNGVSSPLDVFFLKGRIISTAIYFFFIYFFPLQNGPIALFAIILHMVATFLVYVLIEKYIRNSFLSILGATFFAFNAVSQGSVTWSFVAISTIGAGLFNFLAVFYFFKFLESEKKKWIILTCILTYISLWFKESGLYLFLLFPLTAFIYRKYSIVSFFKKFWILLAPFFFVAAFRLVELRVRTTTSNLYLTGHDNNFFLVILFRIILYPLTSFSLMFVPGDQFLSIAREALRDAYPFFSTAPNSPLIAQSLILDLLSLMLTFLLFVFFFLLFKKEKVGLKRQIIFWILFILLSFFPYVVLGKDFSYLESRYYYLAVAGGAFLFSWTLKRLHEMWRGGKFYFIILSVGLLFLAFHMTIVIDKINEQLTLSKWRLNYITDQKKLVPRLTKNKNIFLITGNKNFWADGNILPFQQGTGYTLMVMYFKSGKIPKSFLSKGFLFDIASEGYAEDGEYGFGYFRDEKNIQEVEKKYPRSDISVYRLHYDGEKKMLTK